jgi:hypothetical protein
VQEHLSRELTSAGSSKNLLDDAALDDAALDDAALDDAALDDAALDGNVTI